MPTIYFGRPGEDNAKKGWTPPEEGWYPLKVTEAVEAISKAGKPMLVVKLTTSDGPVTFTAKGFISYTVQWKLREFFKAVGFETEGEQEVNFEQLIGKKLLGMISTRPGDKGVFVDCDQYLPLSDWDRIKHLSPLSKKKSSEEKTEYATSDDPGLNLRPEEIPF